MPLWTRLALAMGIVVACATAVTSAVQSVVARQAVGDEARAGADGVAEVLSRAVAIRAELPSVVEAEIDAETVAQARLVGHLVAVAEAAALPAEQIESRLRRAAADTGVEIAVTDATGTIVHASDESLRGGRGGDEPSATPQARAFRELVEGKVPMVVREARVRENDGITVKEVSVRGPDGTRVVRITAPATFLSGLEREMGLRRLVGEFATSGVREIHVLDARGTPVATRIVDGSGNATDTPRPIDKADAALVRECIAEGRTTGRFDGSTHRSAAPVRRADGAVSGAVLVALASRSEAGAFTRPALAGLASFILVGVPALLAARRIGRRFSEPVEACSAVLEGVGSGEIGGSLPPAGDDETGRLVDATAGMAGALGDSLRRIHAAAARLATEESAVSTALSRQERAVRGFDNAAVDVAGAVGRIAANSDHLLTATADVTIAAREAVRSAHQGRADLDGMSQSMKQLDDEMTVFTRKLATIRQRASGITAVVTTIAKVADQTNLLSVNATIEAEKAGEAGRGFRIVAQEIRRLADQTAQATKDIERMVREMQSAVSGGTMEMDRFRKEVSDRVEAVTRLGDRLAQIVVPVESVTRSLELLHDEMDGQSVRVREAREIMDRLRGGAGQSAETTGSLSTSIDHFRDAIGQLHDEVARYRFTSPPASSTTDEPPLGP